MLKGEFHTEQLPSSQYKVGWLYSLPECLNLIFREQSPQQPLFDEHPGYYAISIEAQGTMPELEKIEDAADAQLIQDLATSLAQRDAGLEPADHEAIAFVLVKAADPRAFSS